MPSLTERSCPECGAAFRGRIDKKFCSDVCRVSFNNRLNSDQVNYIRNVNNILRKNRRILMSMNPTGKNKVPHDKLKAKGFNFNYFTSMYRTREGAQYFYCYDHGYLPIERDWYLLVIRKDFSSA